MESLARNSKQLGAIIRRARRSLKLTQHQLGEKAGLWQESVSKIENGSRGAKLETCLDLLAALDLEIVVRKRSKGSAQEIEEIFR